MTVAEIVKSLLQWTAKNIADNSGSSGLGNYILALEMILKESKAIYAELYAEEEASNAIRKTDN